MGEVIALVSGKGGTGKTTLCAAVGACLAADGKHVLCIDADVGLRNLDIALGMADRPTIAFTDVLHGDYTLSDATEHPQLSNLFLLTAPIRENSAMIDINDFGKLLERARKEFDFCLIDAASGVGTDFRLATRFADRCLVVTASDPSSIRDAGCAANLLALDGKLDLHLIVNRVVPRLFSRMQLTVDDIMDEVGLPLLGLVPEDTRVPLAAAAGKALVLAENDGAAEACLRISRRLRGIPIPLMKF